MEHEGSDHGVERCRPERRCGGVDDDPGDASWSPAQHSLSPVCGHKPGVGRRRGQHRKERAHTGTQIKHSPRGPQGQQLHQLLIGRHQDAGPQLLVRIGDTGVVLAGSTRVSGHEKSR